MLYHPDDPLITWLRDGHLGGITLGSSREQVREQWGEPQTNYEALWVYYDIEHRHSHFLTGFQAGVVDLLQILFRETCTIPWPKSLGTPPFALNARTFEREFLDLMQAHQIPVQQFVYDWHSVDHGRPQEKIQYETPRRIRTWFDRGLLSAISADKTDWYNFY